MNEEEQYIKQIEEELEQAKDTNKKLYSLNQNSIFASEQNENLIRYQLDLKEDLDRIYHLLRGDSLELDDEGNTIWKKADDYKLITFNKLGVDKLMSYLSIYLIKNTLLSYFSDEEQINKRVEDFGYEFSDLIYNNYEQYFYIPPIEELKIILEQKEKEAKEYGRYIDTNLSYNQKLDKLRKDILDMKISNYPLIVLSTVDTIQNAMLRGLKGKERDTLREGRIVTQTEPLGLNNINMSKPNKFSLLKPKTWMK